ATGSYSSALEIIVGMNDEPSSPPATRTLPLASGVAVCRPREVDSAPVALQVPSTGSNSSALDNANSSMKEKPPTTSTFPPDNEVGLALFRKATIAPVGVQVRLRGSNISALVSVVKFPLMPPATSTFPSASSVAVCERRTVGKTPV